MKASVIVPVYNRKDTIGECLDSLLSQDMSDYEIIVIDDGSTDGTQDVLKEFSRTPHICVIYNSQNNGPAFARNRGIEKSRGSFIACTDSDCIASPQWLRELLLPLENDPDVFISCGNTEAGAPQNYWELVNKGENFIQKKSGFANKAIGCNMALRRDFALKHPFDEKITDAAGEDWDICLISLKERGRIFYTASARTAHKHRSTLQSTMRQQFSYGSNNAYVRQKHGVFPLLSYGTWIILTATIYMTTRIIFPEKAPAVVGLLIGCAYLPLPLLVALSQNKTPAETLLSYPGLLLCCLANTLGNMTYLIKSILKIR